MHINGVEVHRPLGALRAVLGDEHIDRLQERVGEFIFAQGFTADELLAIAEYVRLAAETRAWHEERSAREKVFR